MGTDRKIKSLVVDTAAFIKAVPLWEYGEELYCIREVIWEIRDRQTRNAIDRLPVPLKFREPSPESIKFINDFTKKTGDFASLSLVDVKILALTYDLEKEAKGGISHLRSEPVKQRTTEIISCAPVKNEGFSNIEGFYMPAQNEQDKELNNSGSKNGENIGLSSIDEKESVESLPQSEHPVPVVPPQDEEDAATDAVQSDEGIESEEEYEDESEEETEEEEEESEEDEEESEEEEEEEEDEGWITPSNLSLLKQKNRQLVEESPSDVQVACITADYAMQNTLKHIGLHVMGVDGKLIKSLRTFILRCFGCFKTTDKMEQLFCGHCGHKTLKRVSVTMNPDGTQKIWISSRKPISIRGTKFSLPRPKGGKYSINPILVADQREAQQRVTRLSRIKNNPLHEDYEARAGVSPFLTRDVYSRSAQLGLKTGKKGHRGLFYWEQKNPNVPLSKGTTRKKRR